jgi:hypothetical protein
MTAQACRRPAPPAVVRDQIGTRAHRETSKGLRISETSADAEGTKLIRKHAEDVSLYLASGMPEMRQNH